MKVHREALRFAKKGYFIVLIGHRGHPEVEGTMGQYDHSQGGEIYLVEDVEQVEHLQVNNPDRLSFGYKDIAIRKKPCIIVIPFSLAFPQDLARIFNKLHAVAASFRT